MTVIVDDPRTNKRYKVFVEVEAVPNFYGALENEEGEDIADDDTEEANG